MTIQAETRSPGTSTTRGKLYLDLATVLRKRILDGVWPPGERIPSIPVLAKEFGVAVVTVRHALSILENEGLVWCRQGRGTFVTEEAGDRRWLRLESSWESMLRMWETSKARLLQVMDTIGSPALEPRDGIPAAAYRYMRRVHFSDEVPYAVIDIYVDRSLYARNPKRFDSEMVILVLESMPDVEIKTARQTLTIGTADIETSQLLETPLNAPVGEVRRVLQDQHGRVIYVGEAVYRGDLVKLERYLKKQ